MPFGGLLTVGLLGAGSSLFSGILGSNAAQNAAGQQVSAENQALNFQNQIWNQEQANIAPWLSSGQTSIAALMKALGNGSFGAGSNPTFTAPTLAEAQQTPGYQFAAQQGSKGILEGAAAAGGAISGGTLKALDQFNTGLADTTYNDVFSRSLSTYQANLAKQSQEFGQMLAPAQLGEQAAASLNNQGQQSALNIAQLMAGIGNANAAGTVGSTNAITGGINGGVNSLLQSLLLSKFLGTPAGGSAAPTANIGTLANMGMFSQNSPYVASPPPNYTFTGPGETNPFAGIGPG